MSINKHFKYVTNQATKTHLKRSLSEWYHCFHYMRCFQHCLSIFKKKKNHRCSKFTTRSFDFIVLFLLKSTMYSFGSVFVFNLFRWFQRKPAFQNQGLSKYSYFSNITLRDRLSRPCGGDYITWASSYINWVDNPYNLLVAIVVYSFMT